MKLSKLTSDLDLSNTRNFVRPSGSGIGVHSAERLVPLHVAEHQGLRADFAIQVAHRIHGKRIGGVYAGRPCSVEHVELKADVVFVAVAEELDAVLLGGVNEIGAECACPGLATRIGLKPSGCTACGSLSTGVHCPGGESVPVGVGVKLRRGQDLSQAKSALGVELRLAASVDLLLGVPLLAAGDGFVGDLLGLFGAQLGVVAGTLRGFTPLIHAHYSTFCQVGASC